MLLIGLAGATNAQRDEVAGQMAEAGICRVSVYANYASGNERFGTDKRVDKIRALVSVTPKGTDCLVFSQVMTEEEAEEVRRLGGHLCHVQGVPSHLVRIRRGDLMVTLTAGGDRHYLDPGEALSELMVLAGLLEVSA